MRLKLTSADNLQTFELKTNAPMVVGRAPTSDIPVFDPTISRRHAELLANDKALQVKDLGSSNGTFLNGARVESCTVNVGDTITFGKVAFKLQPVAPPAPPPGVPAGLGNAPAGATIVRQVPVRNTPGAAFAAIKSGEQAAVNSDYEKLVQKLGSLLEVSKDLGRQSDLDTMLDSIVKKAYDILTVDRVAIQLMDDGGTLVTKIARDKRGHEQQRAVPQSIARAAVAEKSAILSNDAGEDQRFGAGASILMQQVRSAICVPLVSKEDKVLGILYVDNVSSSHQFTEQDLDFVVAFSGIAAAAIENSQSLQRIQKETLARSNFERYFTPQLAQRIASSEGATRLGGDKRTIAVLFSDIRGFTALSETMRPDDMATLLTEYFTEMVDSVFRNDGTLDKFIGDAVMAQWGAPIGTADDADKAMTAAIEMMKELDKLNAKWRAEGRPELQIGIGLNYGEAFAGNIGSEKRLEFTVIGDTVNTASRLCSAAGPGEILISEEMRQALSHKPPLAVCPPMELKGKSQPVPVFRVVL
ncbi:MAG TPA: adenylate/guanylate cyclase domain-containing protein [Gemmatimonadaceae bacterium]|nr:adenylate/guanylate cyclase domain-containing protein [Gemmatimonadaceae bacterium]